MLQENTILQATERALEDLITILEEQATPAAAITRATDRCVETFEALRALQPQPEPTRVRSLHALARQMVSAAADSTAQRLDRARRARQTLANLRAEAATGTSCDLQV